MTKPMSKVQTIPLTKEEMEAYGRLLRKEPNPIEKAIDFWRNLPLYVKFQDPSGRPGIEVGFKFTF